MLSVYLNWTMTIKNVIIQFKMLKIVDLLIGKNLAAVNSGRLLLKILMAEPKLV
jgi:hypothetical protein